MKKKKEKKEKKSQRKRTEKGKNAWKKEDEKEKQQAKIYTNFLGFDNISYLTYVIYDYLAAVSKI